MRCSVFTCLVVLSLPIFGNGGLRDWFATPTETPEGAVAKWRHLEAQLKSGVEALLKELLPTVVRMSSEVEISPECLGSFLKLIGGVRTFKDWAIRMLDATGKPEGGQLLGSMSALGSYDECLDITGPEDGGPNADIWQGMYCVLDFRIPLPPLPKLAKTSEFNILPNFNFTLEVLEKLKILLLPGYSGGYKLGVCLPSACRKEDLQKVAKVVTDLLGVLTRVRSCEVKEDKIQLDTAQWTIVTVLSLFVLLVTFASIAHYFKFIGENQKPSVLEKVVQSFSAISNIDHLLDTSTERRADQCLSCLNGLRLFSMTWVVLGHAQFLTDFNTQRNLLFKYNLLKSMAFQAVANATLSVDSFFFITSVLVSFHLTSRLNQLEAWTIPVVTAKRIWRLLPSAMLCAGLSVLLPALGSGPAFKEMLEDNANNCRNYWWRLALFINNYFDPLDMCIPHTWYISLDVQFFLVALTYLFIYLRKPLAGKVFLGLLVAGSAVSTTLIMGYKDIIPTGLPIIPEAGTQLRLARFVYMQPHGHLAVYGIGLAVGTFLAKKKQLAIPMLLRLTGWVAAILCSMSALYITVIWNNGEEDPIGWAPAIYGGLHRPLWTLGLAWLTINCALGYGGMLNRFLSWKGYLPLNRLTYLVYLLHLLVICYYQASLRGNVESSQLSVVYLFFGYLSISFGLALIVKLLFEYPTILLEHHLLEYLLPDFTNQGGDQKALSQKVVEDESVLRKNPERKDVFKKDLEQGGHDGKAPVFPFSDVVTRM